MTHTHNPIEALKTVCHDACHERHACTHGYKELMQADNAEGIATVWRRYWQELISDQYADIICKELPHHYAELKEGFNKAGMYFNECPQSYMNRSFVLIGDSEEPIHIYGYAEVYVLGKAHVIAHDHARVYCSQTQGKVELLDYANGNVTAGYAIARDHSILEVATDCECHNASNVSITAGTLHDHGHMEISAYNDAVIETFTALQIDLHENAKIAIRKS